MERLIKNDVLLPLDFSDVDICVDCIKGKYAKTIKKGAIRATGVLQLIHTDICGPLNVKSVDETLDVLLNTEKSMVRFGDGEIVVLSGKNIYFQTTSPEIADGLKRIVGYQYNDLIVTLPDIFEDLDKYVPKTQLFWQDHLLFFRKAYYKFCNPNKVYYNSSVSRGYITYADKAQSSRWFNRFREVFRDKELVIVEGCTTHNGVGNDLLAYAKSVERIICPSRNAYAVREKILEQCLKYGKEKLFLFSLGITAKGLVEALFLQGYRVLDIGNLDMEYEWFLQKADTKVAIAKHQVVGEDENRKAGYDDYLGQIACYIELDDR